MEDYLCTHLLYDLLFRYDINFVFWNKFSEFKDNLILIETPLADQIHLYHM